MVIIILKHLEFMQYYKDEPFLNKNGAIADFLLIMITVLRLNLNQK